MVDIEYIILYYNNLHMLVQTLADNYFYFKLKIYISCTLTFLIINYI
jgi:hypothetical protein